MFCGTQVTSVNPLTSDEALGEKKYRLLNIIKRDIRLCKKVGQRLYKKYEF